MNISQASTTTKWNNNSRLPVKGLLQTANNSFRIHGWEFEASRGWEPDTEDSWENCGQNRRELVYKYSTVWETPIYEQRFQNTEETSVTKTGQNNKLRI